MLPPLNGDFLTKSPFLPPFFPPAGLTGGTPQRNSELISGYYRKFQTLKLAHRKSGVQPGPHSNLVVAKGPVPVVPATRFQIKVIAVIPEQGIES